MSETINCTCGSSIPTDHECFAEVIPFRLGDLACQAIDRYLASLGDEGLAGKKLRDVVFRAIGMFQELGKSGRIYQCYNCGRVFSDDNKGTRYDIGIPQDTLHVDRKSASCLDLQIWSDPVRNKK
jgi:hypothetical protein